jgi:hypothetical protein
MFYVLLGRDLASSNYNWKYLQNYTSGTAYDSYPTPDNFVIINTPIWRRYRAVKAVVIVVIVTFSLAALFTVFFFLMKRLKIRNIGVENLSQISLSAGSNVDQKEYRAIR